MTINCVFLIPPELILLTRYVLYPPGDVAVFTRLRLSQQETELVPCEITIITRQTDTSLPEHFTTS